MNHIAEIKVSVKLKANEKTSAPTEKNALLFSYAPGEGAAAQGAEIRPDGFIDLTKVKAEVRLMFEIVEPSEQNPTLVWKSGEYRPFLRSNAQNNPERDTLLIGKCPKPGSQDQLKPYPIGGREFIAFYYSGNDNRSIHVHTRNTDDKGNYWYALGVNLRNVDVAAPGKDVVCRHDPQIKNGGNTGVSFTFFWKIAGLIVIANILATALIQLFVRPH